jgi:hypothetical protein
VSEQELKAFLMLNSSAESSMAVRRIGRPFQRGQSGNPGGRPKGYEEVRELARNYTAGAIEALAAIMRTGKSEGARIAAANALLERGWGKPLQQVDVKRSPLDGLTTDELLVILELVETAVQMAKDNQLPSDLARLPMPDAA